LRVSGSPLDHRPASIVLSGGRVLEADGRLVERDVFISEGKITAPDAGAQGAPGWRRVNVDGMVVLPGLIDAHTHLTHAYAEVTADSEAGQGIRAARQAVRALRAGITTVRELGSYRHVDIALRQAIADGLASGPRMLCSGLHIGMTGGHCHHVGRSADGPDEVRRAVREQLMAGADVIKLMCSGGTAREDESATASQFTRDEIRAGVDEALLAERPVACHAHPARSIKWAVEAGATSIEHGTFLDDEAIEMMRSAGTFLVPTLAVYARLADRDPRPSVAERARHVFSVKKQTLAAAWHAGVRVAVGTDTSEFFPIEDYPRECELIAEACELSALDVLLAATRGNAELLGLTETGAVTEGWRADLIVVEGDPTTTLADLRRVRYTICGGVVFDWGPLDDGRRRT
jgi:imidazolonepropionase-like amidohydrolase